MQRVPLMFLPVKVSKAASKVFLGISGKIARIYPGLGYDLEKTDLDFKEEEYIASALLHSLLFFVLFFFLFFILLFRIQIKELNISLIKSSGYSLMIFFLILLALLRYPRIVAGKKAEQVDKHLVFALKDLYLQIGSGVSLYNSMVNVAKADYGIVSEEFRKVARAINTGMPMAAALEKMATSSSSEFLRRTTWQLVNTLKAGASLKGALRSVIDELTADQRNKIRDYAHELNLWSLVYMLFAVAIPTIGATLLVILSSFAGFGVTQGMFIIFIVACFFVQYVLIGLVKARRPVVQF